MISFEFNESDKAGVLSLEGEISIEQAEELKAALVSALGSADRVMVDVERVTTAGLPCLELLCSAHKTALSMDKELQVSANPPDEFLRAVRDSGYTRHTGCELDQQDRCFWIDGIPSPKETERQIDRGYGLDGQAL